MFFKKPYFFAYGLSLMLYYSAPAPCGIFEVVDCIAARVDAEIITLTEVRIIQGFGLGSEQTFQPASAVLRRCLEAAIDRKVVINLAPVNVTVLDWEIEELQNRIKVKFEPAEWERKLNEFGLEEEDLNSYLREILLYEKIIALRFSQSVDVSLKEIETYYQRVYRPEQETRGEKPLPMIQVLGEIEARIRKEKMEKQVLRWIENLRRQSEVRINSQCLEQNLPSGREG